MATEMPINGQHARSGSGRKGIAISAMTAGTMVIVTMSRNLLRLALTIAFHDACINAASRTSSVTSKDIIAYVFRDSHHTDTDAVTHAAAISR